MGDHPFSDKWSMFLKSSPIPTGLLRNGRFIDINPPFSLRTGYSVEDAIGKTMDDLGLVADLKGLISANYIDDQGRESLLVMIDVSSEIKDLERFLAVNQDLLLITDRSGKIVRLNDAWTELLGYSLDSIKSSDLLDFVHPDDHRATLDILSSLAEQKKVARFVNRFRSTDGTYRYFEWRAYPYDDFIYGSARDITESKNAEARILYLSNHDALTGLYNRYYFDQKIDQEIDRADRYRISLSMVMLDLDHFKQINDQWGHPVGDDVLKWTAQIIQGSIRQPDILVRLGGEEFMILMPHTPASGAMTAAEKIRKNLIETPHPIAGQVTASFGVAERKYGETHLEWYKRVDEAMYQAKEGGRNRVVRADRQQVTHPTIVSLQWQRDWECGNTSIDKQHQDILELANDFINIAIISENNAYHLKRLDILIKHVISHFRSEEQLLRTINYPDLTAHEKSHQDLVDKVLLFK